MSLATRYRAALRRLPAGHHLPATLRNAAGTETTGTVLDGVLRDQVRAPDAAVTSTRADHQVALLAEGLDFAPATGMWLTVAGTRWTVLDVEVMEPTDAGVPILYRLDLAR